MNWYPRYDPRAQLLRQRVAEAKASMRITDGERMTAGAPLAALKANRARLLAEAERLVWPGGSRRRQARVERATR